jgi:DNA repair protein RAD51
MEKEKKRRKKEKVIENEEENEEIEEKSEILKNLKEEHCFLPIEKLIEHGISKIEIDKLKGAGFTTLESLHYSTTNSFKDLKGISSMKLEKIFSTIKIYFPDKIEGSRKALIKRSNIVYLSTGCSELDSILNGGIESGSLTEIFGEFRTGKTQLCHTLCITCQLPKSKGGGEGKALYIDTEGTFRPEKLKPIAERYGLDVDEAIENVYYARAYNHEHQLRLLSQAAALMSETKFSLLIIDSATHLYRTDFSGRGELSARQMHLAKFLRGCQKLADEFGVAVILTNQVVACVDNSFGCGPDKKPIGGHIMAHASQTRLSLRKGQKENRFCKIYDSPCLPEVEAGFSVNDDGVRDPK